MSTISLLVTVTFTSYISYSEEIYYNIQLQWMVPGRRGEILLHVRVLQNQNQEKGLAPHQHRQEVDGTVTARPTKPYRVLLVHARVRF